MSAKRRPAERKNATDVVDPGDGELEDEIEPRDAVDEDQEDVDELRGAAKKLEHERKLKQKRNLKYKHKKAAERRGAAGPGAGSGDAEVDEVLGKDPELRKVYEEFGGKIGTAEDLAGVYAMIFAPIGAFVHEDFTLHNADGSPTAECLQLARGTWPAMRKYAGAWLAWVRQHSPEVLAISTLTFFAGRKIPTVFALVNDPSQLRINRLRAAAAADAPKHPPAREGAAAASQVVDLRGDQKPESGKQEAA